MKPAILSQRDGVQQSYSLPGVVHSTHVYPRKSLNGSTVIVYGHDSGLRVIWYAGRKFKPATIEPPKVNGKSKKHSDVIELDDSDEEPEPIKPPASVDFEDDEDEIDPSEPYPHVLRHLDIPLGVAVLHIAQPETPFLHVDLDRYPSILQDNIVLAVACSDLSIRLLSCPLTPPTPGLADVLAIGIQVVKLPLGGVGFHQDFVTSIAISFTEQQEGAVEDDGPRQSSQPSQQWSFLIASTSCTGSGLLLIHQVPVNGTRFSTNPQDLVPIRRVRPLVPLCAATLSFNTCLPPSDRHSSLLIALPDSSCAKVYQVFPQSSINRNRRGSAGTMDSVSSRGSSYNSNSQNGRMLISLLPDFLASTNSLLPVRRKRVLDSKWIMGGRAILALLDDGEFGIWDLEAAGPASSASNKNPIKGQSNITGIVGGSLTRFSVFGRFPARDSASQTSKAATSSSMLAPATPHTRKTQADGLFKGAESSSQPQDSSLMNAHGRISIVTTSNVPLTESALLTFNAANLHIPSIQAFWHTAAASGKNTIKIGTFNGPVLLPSLNTIGGVVNQLTLLPEFPNQRTSNYGSKEIPNFLASTSTRLVLFIQPFAEATPDPAEPILSRALTIRPNEDSLLIQSRELDISAMDEILDNMETSRQISTMGRAKPNFGKSVAFIRDDEGDIDMTSPSPAEFGALASLKSSGTQRRLFS